MICPKCGKEIADDSVFCRFCGASLEMNEPEEVAGNSSVIDDEIDYDALVEGLDDPLNDFIFEADDFDTFDGSQPDQNDTYDYSFEEPAIAWCNGNALGRTEVMEYLQKVVDIQANLETCREIVDELSKKAREASGVWSLTEPAKPFINLKKGIIGIILGLVISSMGSGSSWIVSLIGYAIIAVAAWICFIKPVLYANAATRKHQEEVDAKNAENQMILENCNNALPVVKTIENSCYKSLQALYGTDIIKPKYRTLPACSFILEQLENETTHSLIHQPGDDGAYNKWEEMLRHKEVTESLDEIKGSLHKIEGKLDVIMQNQKILYDKMNQINENVKHVARELEQIKVFSALTAVNTSQMKQQLQRIAASNEAIEANTVSMKWAADCTARNTSATLSDSLRYKTGLSFDF